MSYIYHICHHILTSEYIEGCVIKYELAHIFNNHDIVADSSGLKTVPRPASNAALSQALMRSISPTNLLKKNSCNTSVAISSSIHYVPTAGHRFSLCLYEIQAIVNRAGQVRIMQILEVNIRCYLRTNFRSLYLYRELESQLNIIRNNLLLPIYNVGEH